MSTRNPPGTGMLRLAAAILFIGGRSWRWSSGRGEWGPWCSASGLSCWGLVRSGSGGHRSERFLGVALLLGGAFTAIDGSIRLLSGASP
jgi:hypothetical protein